MINGAKSLKTFWVAMLLTLALPPATAVALARDGDHSGDVALKMAWQNRHERVSRWYAPARFGLFCHWGLFTGGGDSSSEEQRPFAYDSVTQFEAAAGRPESVASNLVAAAKMMGARYLTITLVHSCDRYMVMFPAKTPGFKIKTTRDYIGAIAERCHAENIPFLLYLCGGSDHGFDRGGPWLDESLRDAKTYVSATKGLLDELATLHPDEIAGFWIDGAASDLPAYMRLRFPNCIVIHNNDSNLDDPNIDYGTTEFLSGPAEPDYSRPSGLTRTHPRWNILPPRRDFNEDIPTAGNWWYQSSERLADLPCVKDPTYAVKQMVSSLGQRRQWNFALGVGPMIDGRFPPELAAMSENFHKFFAWAAESIYDTTGGEDSALNPGWWNDGAYGSVTVSLKNPRLLYVHVTTAPRVDNLRVPNNGYKIASVSDLRTGKTVSFWDGGSLRIQNKDWADVAAYGDKIFKVTLAEAR
jgi:hypothetical protein